MRKVKCGIQICGNVCGTVGKMRNALLNGLKTALRFKAKWKKTLKKYVTNFFVYRYYSVELICFCLRKYKKELHDIHQNITKSSVLNRPIVPVTENFGGFRGFRDCRFLDPPFVTFYRSVERIAENMYNFSLALTPNWKSGTGNRTFTTRINTNTFTFAFYCDFCTLSTRTTNCQAHASILLGLGIRSIILI